MVVLKKITNFDVNYSTVKNGDGHTCYFNHDQEAR